MKRDVAGLLPASPTPKIALQPKNTYASPMTTATPPRRKWHLQRWLLLLAAGLLAYAGWTQYAFRAALSQARALGWVVEYTDPIEEIGKSWKAAFKKETWLDGGVILMILTSEEFEQHLAIVHRLNPIWLTIGDAGTLDDLSALAALTRLQTLTLSACTRLTNVDALKNLSLKEIQLTGGARLTNVDALKTISSLQDVSLIDCPELTNVDGLKNLSALQMVCLDGCTGLTNVDGLIHLSALQIVRLSGCTGLTIESLAALNASIPNVSIFGP